MYGENLICSHCGKKGHQCDCSDCTAEERDVGACNHCVYSIQNTTNANRDGGFYPCGCPISAFESDVEAAISDDLIITINSAK